LNIRLLWSCCYCLQLVLFGACERAGTPAETTAAAKRRADNEALVKVTYMASTATITNPERGMYRMPHCESPLNQSQLERWRTNENDSLILCVFYLREFTESEINPEKLSLFQRQMDIVRNAGSKAIVRFAYSADISGRDASPSMVQTHLDQIAPYLLKNKDVIAAVQAGFIGGWGEWAYSHHFGTGNDLSIWNRADRRTIVAKLLQVVPADRMVQLRTPAIKRNVVGTSVLTAAEAYNGSAKARLGHHNDCFLASANDWGTYGNTSADYPYLEAETKYLPMGGETCNYNPPRTDCPTALAELAKFHWSYLHLDYLREVVDGWKKQSCFTEIKQKLGYRFVLQDGTYSRNAKAGGVFQVHFNVRNDGWAAPFNSRNVELVLRHTVNGALYRVKLNTDPRRWMPGQSTAVHERVTLPLDMPKGSYAILLHLPDASASLRNRPEYAIRLANHSVWEASTGFNSLNYIVSIDSSPG
jgi:hypothetical protein